ncbi:hypothetical protein HDU76_001986, partial [Blyttiomyces sp. JEL0837]
MNSADWKDLLRLGNACKSTVRFDARNFNDVDSHNHEDNRVDVEGLLKSWKDNIVLESGGDEFAVSLLNMNPQEMNSQGPDCTVLITGFPTLPFSARNCCLTAGVTCDQNDRVTAVSFASTGTTIPNLIPNTIGSLTELRSFSLSGFGIPGEIPAEFGLLKNLVALDLSNNFLTGVVPDLSGAAGLANVNLSGNCLQGVNAADIFNIGAQRAAGCPSSSSTDSKTQQATATSSDPANPSTTSDISQPSTDTLAGVVSTVQFTTVVQGIKPSTTTSSTFATSTSGNKSGAMRKVGVSLKAVFSVAVAVEATPLSGSYNMTDIETAVNYTSTTNCTINQSTNNDLIPNLEILQRLRSGVPHDVRIKYLVALLDPNLVPSQDYYQMKDMLLKCADVLEVRNEVEKIFADQEATVGIGGSMSDKDATLVRDVGSLRRCEVEKGKESIARSVVNEVKKAEHQPKCGSGLDGVDMEFLPCCNNERYRGDLQCGYAAVVIDNWKPIWEVEERKPIPITACEYLQQCPRQRESIWGEQPALDVLHTSTNEMHLSDIHVLMAYASDLRDTIKTITSLPSNFNNTLHIHLNHPNAFAMARNLCFLTLLGQSTSHDLLDATIAACYSVRMTNSQLDRIIAILKPLYAAGPTATSWNLDSTIINLGQGFNLIHSQLKEFIKSANKIKSDNATQAYQTLITSPAVQDIIDRKLIFIPPHQRIGWLRHRNSGILLPMGESTSNHNVANPFTFDKYPNIAFSEFAEKLMGWDFKDVINTANEMGLPSNDLYGALFFHIRSQMKTFVDNLTRHKIVFHLSCMDPLKIPTSPLLDRIWTSTLADEIGLPTLLKTYTNHLNKGNNPYSTLITCNSTWTSEVDIQTHHLVRESFAREMEYQTQLTATLHSPRNLSEQATMSLRMIPDLRKLDLGGAFLEWVKESQRCFVVAYKSDVRLRMRWKNEIVPRRVGGYLVGDGFRDDSTDFREDNEREETVNPFL